MIKFDGRIRKLQTRPTLEDPELQRLREAYHKFIIAGISTGLKNYLRSDHENEKTLKKILRDEEGFTVEAPPVISTGDDDSELIIGKGGEQKVYGIKNQESLLETLDKKNISGIKPYKRDDVVAYLYLFDLMETLEKVLTDLLDNASIEEATESLTKTAVTTAAESTPTRGVAAAAAAAAKAAVTEAEAAAAAAQSSFDRYRYSNTRSNRRNVVEAESKLLKAKEKVKAAKKTAARAEAAAAEALHPRSEEHAVREAEEVAAEVAGAAAPPRTAAERTALSPPPPRSLAASGTAPPQPAQPPPPTPPQTPPSSPPLATDSSAIAAVASAAPPPTPPQPTPPDMSFREFLTSIEYDNPIKLTIQASEMKRKIYIECNLIQNSNFTLPPFSTTKLKEWLVAKGQHQDYTVPLAFLAGLRTFRNNAKAKVEAIERLFRHLVNVQNLQLLGEFFKQAEEEYQGVNSEVKDNKEYKDIDGNAGPNILVFNIVRR